MRRRRPGLDTLVSTYANELENTPVRVNLLSPGPMRTRMRAAAMPGEDPETLAVPAVLMPFCSASCPELTVTGKLFDFRQDRLLDLPAPGLRFGQLPSLFFLWKGFRLDLRLSLIGTPGMSKNRAGR